MNNLLIEKEYRHPETGLLHRVDGPALITTTGTEIWIQNGMKHRTDGPAVIRTDGYQAWYQHDIRHNSHGPAIVTPLMEVMFYLGGDTITFKEWVRLTGASSKTLLEISLKYNIRDM